jgi:hypothetical protein
MLQVYRVEKLMPATLLHLSITHHHHHHYLLYKKTKGVTSDSRFFSSLYSFCHYKVNLILSRKFYFKKKWLAKYNSIFNECIKPMQTYIHARIHTDAFGDGLQFGPTCSVLVFCVDDRFQ